MKFGAPEIVFFKNVCYYYGTMGSGSGKTRRAKMSIFRRGNEHEHASELVTEEVQSDGSVSFFDSTRDFDSWKNGNSKLHRIDGPAIIGKRKGGEEWWVNGKLHRWTGPAVIHANGMEEYWLSNKRFGAEEFKEIVGKKAASQAEVKDLEAIGSKTPEKIHF
jgi:hypothetical protein